MERVRAMAKDERQVINLKEKQRIAFVGSGGAVKALGYHMGVLMALNEYGIGVKGYGADHEIQTLVGSSAGSLFGSFIVNNFDFNRIQAFLEEKSFWRYFYNPRPREKGKMYGLSYLDIFPPNIPSPADAIERLSDHVTWERYKNGVNDLAALARTFFPEILKTGDVEVSLEHALKSAHHDYMGIEGLIREVLPFPAISNTDRIERYMNDILEIDDFRQLQRERGIDFFVIASELNRPRKAIFGPRRSPFSDDPWADRYVDSIAMSTACAASSALPIIYRPKKIVIEGEKGYYVDGEVKQTLSTHVAAENGADLIIVSHNLEPYRYDHTKRSLTRHGFMAITIQSVFIGMSQKIRTAWQTHEMRHRIYDHISTPEFQKELDALLKGQAAGKTGKLKKELTEFLEETVARLLNIDKKLQYLYLPSNNEIFWMDHFNIFPHYMKRLANAAYRNARDVIETNYRVIR